MRVLLLSNSTLPGTQFFTWPRPFVEAFLGERKLKLAFIPFAAVTLSFDDYEQKVKEVFEQFGHELSSIHHFSSKRKSVENADGIVVGGGNSFALLHRMYEYDLIEAVRSKVTLGIPYIGWSAGANLACPTIMTTNDMPIVQPRSLKALALVSFQINPHYHELKFEGQGGETRMERLREFVEWNQNKTVLGLPEGMLVERQGDSLTVKGDPQRVAKVIRFGREISDVVSGMEISALIR